MTAQIAQIGMRLTLRSFKRENCKVSIDIIEHNDMVKHKHTSQSIIFYGSSVTQTMDLGQSE